TVTVINPDPISVTPGANAALCFGQSITLNASSIANPAYTYSWDANTYNGSGFNNPLAGAQQTVTPTVAGNYVYTVTGTNGVCTATATVTTAANALPTITTVTGTPAFVCNNDSISLAASSFVTGPQTLPAGYCAVQNAGGSGSMINNVVFNTIANNTAATNPVGAPYATAFNLTTTVNIGQTYPLTVTIDPIGIYSLTTASVWIDFNRNGIYEVTEWFNAGINIPSGTSSTVNITIPANALPGLTGMRIRTRGNTLNNATYGCTYMGSGESEDYQVNIQAAPANPYTYTWNTIPAATGATTTTPAINNTASNLVVTYIVTANDPVTGCVNQDTTNNITIYPPILPPTVVNSAHCGIQIPTAVANDVNGFVGPNYNWYATAVNANALQSTAANTYNTLVGNTTTLYVAVEDTLTGCETSSTPVTITVAAGPALTLASTQEAICVGNTSSAVGLSAGAGTYNTFTWSPAAGVSGNEITGWSFNPAVSTAYTLVATQSAAPNCSNQDTININVDQVIPPAPTVAQNSFNVCSGTNSILLGASFPIVNNTFTYTLNFFDSFGDGWNGNTINVSVNGSPVLSGVTLPSGSNGSQTFTVNGGQTITTQFNAIGSWINECTYNITDQNGNVIFSGTPASASGPPSLTTPYLVPVSPQPNFVVNWYNASTNGTNVGTGSPLQAVGTTVMPTATNGTYTFYAGLSLGACNSATTVPVTVNVADVAGTLTAVNTCINATNGTFTASNFTCGTAPFDYSVNSGPYGPIPTNLAAGTYTVVIRDANLLFSPTYTINVGIDSTIPPAPTVPPALYSVCTGVNSVLLAATPPVLQGSQTYTLNFFDSFGDGWNGNTINVLINGVPVLNGVTLPNGSIGTATFTVNNGDVLTTQFNAIGFWIAECTYSITGPGNTLVFSGTPASAVGPPSLTNGITITTPPANPQPNYILNWYNASTNGAFVGTGSPLQAVGTTVMPTAANGQYTFYVGTSLGSCNSATTVPVTVDVADVAATITPINATCNGVANGSFTATNFTCGSGPYDYSVNNGAFGPIPANLPAGNHTVVIRDANNLLSSVYNFTITQPAWSINAPVAAANGSACFGDTSEIISAASTISGQTATVTQTFTLASNVFFGGGGTQSFTQNISLPAGATVTSTQLSFNNVSTANFGWPSDYTVSLTGASTLGTTTLAFVNQEVSNAGPYLQNPSLLNNNGGNVTVNINNTYPPGTGFFGSVTLVVTYTTPAPASATTWWNAATGGATVANGFSINSVGTAVLPNTLTPGVYNFYAQGEANGCSSLTRTLVTVTVHALPNVNGGNNAALCIGQSTTLTATGANTYSWNNGISNGVAFAPNATNSYIVTGVDVNGCVNQDTVTIVVNPLPVVSAGANQTVCLNTPVVLSASGASTYVWNNGVTNNTPFTPTTTNNYIVTGTDVNGCVNTDTATVTVLPLPNVNAGQDFAICVGLGATLTGTGATTYQWNNNVNNGVTFFPNTTTTYTVIGTGANGCSAQDSVVITVNTTPSISLTNGGAACANGNVALNATTTGAFGGFWSSTNGGGTFAPNVSNANVVYNANGNDPATVTFVYVAFNQCGASNDTTVINILGLPTVNAGIDASLCTGANATLTATSTGTVVWNNGILDGVAFPAVGGTTNYIATATGVNGCTNTDTVSITGLALPQVNAGADQTICSGDFVTLNASGAVTYAWNNNVIDGVPFAPAATTTFTVTGTGANGCDNTDNVTVTVNALPNAVAIAADPVTLVATPSGATYQWFNCATGQIIADATNDTLVASANGSYAVIVTNASGCSDTSDCMIVDQVGIYFPESAVIGLYPNPTNGMVTLEIPAQEGATAFVYDAQGKLILTVANAKNGEQFDLSKLSTGVYTFRVTLNNLTHIEKVVKH
ncbi:MAG: GEVED domain-containing protein, partial [Flavobacteriales bacterium]